MTPTAYKARFVWKPAIVRPPGKVVRVEELPAAGCIETVDLCPPEQTTSDIVPSILATSTGGDGDVHVVIRPPGRIIRVGATDNEPVHSAANCPAHAGCMCCLLVQIEKRLTQSTDVLNQLYAALLQRRAEQLQLDMASDEGGEDLEALESADSVYGSSEELEDMDGSMNADVSIEE